MMCRFETKDAKLLFWNTDQKVVNVIIEFQTTGSKMLRQFTVGSGENVVVGTITEGFEVTLNTSWWLSAKNTNNNSTKCKISCENGSVESGVNINPGHTYKIGKIVIVTAS